LKTPEYSNFQLPAKIIESRPENYDLTPVYSDNVWSRRRDDGGTWYGGRAMAVGRAMAICRAMAIGRTLAICRAMAIGRAMAICRAQPYTPAD
jgi:hypothetical protein